MRGADDRAGLAYGAAAYGMWGVFPILFKQVAAADPFEVLAHRVLWSLVLCLILLGILRTAFPWSVVRSPRGLALTTIAAVLIGANWTVYVYGVNTDRVVETSLGYFLNPLVTIALGVLVLRERLRVLQWVAVALGAVAVTILSVAAGRLPWIAIALAVLFGLYGLTKKYVGQSTGALAGLTLETLLLLPVAVGLLWWFGSRGTLAFGSAGVTVTSWLVLLGAFTAVPLLCFAAGASRLPLTSMGMMQYIAPTLQFVIGVAVYHEHMSMLRWVGFSLVWLALAVFTTDLVRNAAEQRKLRRGR